MLKTHILTTLFYKRMFKMDMFEEAAALAGTIKMCNITQSEMARRLGVSQSYIANKLRLLRFSEEERRSILSSQICERQARALLRLDEKQRYTALEVLKKRRMTVAECEGLIDFLYDKQMPERISRAKNNERIDSLIESIKSSVEALTALGIDATRTVSRYDNKTYITLCIEDSAI